MTRERVTPSSDMFSFATVISHTAAWLVGGRNEMRSYLNARVLYHETNVWESSLHASGFEDCFHDGYKALPIIAEQHTKFKQMCQPSDRTTPLVLDLVEKGILFTARQVRLTASAALQQFERSVSNLSLDADGELAITNPDSGYGTASRAGTTVNHHTSTQIDPDIDDAASVMTNNLPLDLAEGAEDAYVKEFVRQILEATNQASFQDVQRADLIRMLPELLRAFALRISFVEKTEAGRDVGIFTRQNRG